MRAVLLAGGLPWPVLASKAKERQNGGYRKAKKGLLRRRKDSRSSDTSLHSSRDVGIRAKTAHGGGRAIRGSGARPKCDPEDVWRQKAKDPQAKRRTERPSKRPQKPKKSGGKGRVATRLKKTSIEAARADRGRAPSSAAVGPKRVCAAGDMCIGKKGGTKLAF